jgi:hypothetical protein
MQEQELENQQKAGVLQSLTIKALAATNKQGTQQ